MQISNLKIMLGEIKNTLSYLQLLGLKYPHHLIMHTFKFNNKKIKLDSFLPPYDLYFLNKTNIQLLTTTTFSANTYLIKVLQTEFYNLSLLLYTSLIYLNFTLLELYTYILSTKHICIYNICSIFQDYRLNCFIDIDITKQLNILSLSSIYLNSSWLEREVVEFSSLVVLNLRDTRRLMTDYTLKKNINTTNETYTIFNELNQEIFL